MTIKDHLEEIKTYINDGKSQKEIAETLGVTPSAISIFFRENGLYTRRKSKAKPLKQYIKEYQRRRRTRVIKMMGGKCVRCGFADIRALQIDHINGGGSKEHKSIQQFGVQRKILNDPLLINTEYQLLCANCNWIKRHENKEVRNSND